MSADAARRRLPARGSVRLDMPVTYLKGVGERRAALLRRLGIVTAGDLLTHVPHRYEDATTVSPIAALAVGMDATIVGTVISKGVLPTRRGLRIFQVVLRDDSGMIEVSWPGQPFLDRVIGKQDVLLVAGTIRFFHGRQLQAREYVNLGAGAAGLEQGRVLAVYPTTEGLSVKVLRSLLDQHLDALLPLAAEFLSPSVLSAAGVPPLPDALRMVHHPTSLAEAAHGRSRLAFEELLSLQILHRRANAIARVKRTGVRYENRKQLTAALKAALPYELTRAQVRVLREIVADMRSATKMHRLLQGDVGSGKTIVALFAALLAMDNGYQAAMMAPTELLAEQHMRTTSALLEGLGIRPLLVTGSLAASERRAAAQRMAEDGPLLVIGTHALVQEDARFARLGLAIVDEQHRFGVEQRQALGSKGQHPDVLLLSATPIPRSLALTAYGDLDVSVLDERPPGRRGVMTALRPESARARVLSFIGTQVAEGRQAYVVYPVIGESERADLKSATAMYASLSGPGGAFADRRVALLHGRVPADERDAVMRAFRDGAIDVLVATTVIEVGIDVPNATVMLIEHPERFGLSQLHQLRGRVGRGSEESYCILLGDAGPEASDRLRLFAGTEDGFEIARADLRLRGMGDLFGAQQSGTASFRVADPLRDEELNERARLIAEQILADDPELGSPQNAALRRSIGARYARGLELFRVG
jgi:ATP-dependent DNA helicase RecG